MVINFKNDLTVVYAALEFVCHGRSERRALTRIILGIDSHHRCFAHKFGTLHKLILHFQSTKNLIFRIYWLW